LVGSGIYATAYEEVELAAVLADGGGVDASDLVLVQGLRDTRQTLSGWSSHPWPVVRGWVGGSLLLALGLLGAVLAVASIATPDQTPYIISGLQTKPEFSAVGHLLFRNSLVLALHSMACVAGFIAGSSLPLQAERHSGLWRKVHDHAGRVAIAFVSAATLFSLTTQALILGNVASTLSHQFGMSPALLLLGLLPHALPELFALFLPLAAWLIASRRKQWNTLLAATFVTTGIAVPLLMASALIEVYVSPHLLVALSR
jgi:hypothetical protein